MIIKKIEAGKPFDFTQLKLQPKNRVARIGVELEGGWDRNKLPPSTRIDSDGSVFRLPEHGIEVQMMLNGAGEMVPRPLPPGTPSRYNRVIPAKEGINPANVSVGEIQVGPMVPGSLLIAMKKFYPQIYDKSCGLHVHMSFESLKHYSMLMDGPEYQLTVLSELTKWAKEAGIPDNHHIWDRLAGKNEYCQIEFWPDKQVNANKDYDHKRDGHRYTAVSYRHKYTKTIEVRVLPMLDDWRLAAKAVRKVIDITNSSLAILRRREKFKGELILSPNEQYEEFVEELIP